MTIPTITPLPQAPQVTDAPSVFSQRANTFVAALGQLVTETNATTAEINQALAGALVLFDAYEGDWEAGSYGQGDVVRKDGEFYISLVDSNTQEPPGSQWQVLLTTQPEIDASQVISGILQAARIPNLDATKITSGSFNTDRIPNLDATKITSGSFNTARIPNLDATKITSGSFNTARIPNLNASKITAGTFADARIPNLNASKITSGNLAAARITNALNAGGSAPVFACRAWAVWASTSLSAGGNVSSVTRTSSTLNFTNGYNYTVNLSTSMPNSNYSAQYTNGSQLPRSVSIVTSRSAGSFVCRHQQEGTLAEFGMHQAAIFG